MSFPAIPFARPDIGSDEEAAVLRVLRSGWLTTGREALAFEGEFAAKVGSAWGLAVNSATSGLHLALEASGVKAGDYVLTSPYTFTATTEVMRYLGAHPLFVDIDPASFHLDPDLVAQALERGKRGQGPMPVAIMPVHIGGIGWRMDEIYDLAAHYGIPVVEDAAHAFPARLESSAPRRAAALEAAGKAGVCLGAGGDLGVYSFYANKTITTGEGGMITGDLQAWQQRMKIMRSHGIDRDVWNRFTGNAQQWRYAVVEAGFKYNMPDLAAAIGRVQLERADALMEARRRIVARYVAALGDQDWLELPPGSREVESRPLDHSWHLFSIRLKAERCPVARDEWVGRLQAAGIGSSVHYIPLHIMPYYQAQYGLKAADFPRALEAYEEVLSLPLWSGMDDEAVERVIATVLTIGQTG